MCLNDMSCNGKSQARASLALALMVWGLVKFIEDALKLLWGNACARI
jgi:hypothetical protein